VANGYMCAIEDFGQQSAEFLGVFNIDLERVHTLCKIGILCDCLSQFFRWNFQPLQQFIDTRGNKSLPGYVWVAMPELVILLGYLLNR